jgi:hypothetical protein
MKLAEFNIFPEEELCSRCNSARQCEYNYLWLEPTTGDMSEQNIVNLPNDSDTSGCSSGGEDEGEEEVVA